MVVLLDGAIEIGMVLGDAIYHNGGDISSLHISRHNETGRLETFLSSLSERRAELLRHESPDTTLPASGLTFMHMQYAALHGDVAALLLVEEITDILAQVFSWIIAMLRPDHISLAGGIVDLGETVLNRIMEKAESLVQPELVQ